MKATPRMRRRFMSTEDRHALGGGRDKRVSPLAADEGSRLHRDRNRGDRQHHGERGHHLVSVTVIILSIPTRCWWAPISSASHAVNHQYDSAS